MDARDEADADDAEAEEDEASDELEEDLPTVGVVDTEYVVFVVHLPGPKIEITVHQIKRHAKGLKTSGNRLSYEITLHLPSQYGRNQVKGITQDVADFGSKAKVVVAAEPVSFVT